MKFEFQWRHVKTNNMKNGDTRRQSGCGSDFIRPLKETVN